MDFEIYNWTTAHNSGLELNFIILAESFILLEDEVDAIIGNRRLKKGHLMLLDLQINSIEYLGAS